MSKSNHKYFSFLPKEGCDHLAAHLYKRISNGEEFDSETPIISMKTGYKKDEYTGSQFMTTRNVSRIIREAMRPRFKWRPYVLRSYCDTQMLLSESHGKITHPTGFSSWATRETWKQDILQTREGFPKT